jgi:hypothetical protein
MTPFKVVEWSETLDLSDFYSTAHKKGFENNSSQKMLVDSLRSEKVWKVWIVYHGDIAVGSFAAHSLDFLPGYRICVRTCAFSDRLPLNNLRTTKGIIDHENITSQIYIPVTIEHFGKNSNFYITTHPSDVGTQRAVHNVWAPLMKKSGVVDLEIIKEYRGHIQHFWKFNVENFYQKMKPNKMFAYTTR